MKDHNWTKIVLWMRRFATCILICALSACTTNRESADVRTQHIQHINYSATLLSSESLAAREMSSHTYSPDQRDSIKQAYDASVYFLLNIYPDNEFWNQGSNDFIAATSGSFDDFRANLDYLIYHVDESLKLDIGTDTVSPILFHCERGFELTPEQKIIVAFERPSDVEELTLVFQDELFNNGIIKFHYNI